MKSVQSVAMENELAALKSRLNEFVQQYAIKRFEADDIVELVQEGESTDWIVDQLKSDDPGLNTDAVTLLLSEIKNLIRPEERPEEVQESEETAEAAVESGTPEASDLDLSQLDLSQIGTMLPPGMQLPPGLSMKEIRNLLESPHGKIMADLVLFAQERGVDLSSGNLNDPRAKRLQEEWQSTPRDAFDGKTPAEMLSDMPGKVETYRREEPRIGRNDPCPCGSGKKYKKCCGRGQ